MNGKVEIDFNEDFDGLVKRISEKLEHGLSSLAADTVQNAQDIVKTSGYHKTGHNASSITWDREGDSFRVYTQSGYGGYLELGTSKMPGKPYLRPGAMKSIDNLSRFLDEG